MSLPCLDASFEGVGEELLLELRKIVRCVYTSGEVHSSLSVSCFLLSMYAFIVLMSENRIVSSKRKLLSTTLTQIAKACLQGTHWSIEAVGTCPASIAEVVQTFSNGP